MALSTVLNPLISLSETNLSKNIYLNPSTNQIGSNISFFYRTTNLSKIQTAIEQALVNLDSVVSHSKMNTKTFKANIAIINDAIEKHNNLVSKLSKLPCIIQWFASFIIDLQQYSRIQLDDYLNLNQRFWHRSEYKPSTAEFKKLYDQLPQWMKDEKRAKIIELGDNQTIDTLIHFFRKTIPPEVSTPFIFLSNDEHIRGRPFRLIMNNGDSSLSAEYIEKTTKAKFSYKLKTYETIDAIFESQNVFEFYENVSKDRDPLIANHPDFKGSFKNISHFRKKETSTPALFYSKQDKCYLYASENSIHSVAIEEGQIVLTS